MARKLISVVFLLWASLLFANRVQAQGIFIISGPHPIPLPRPMPPRTPPTMSYKIKELGVVARVQDQVAKVQVTQTMVNTGSQQMEVSFCFPLPYDGAIDQMTFMVDGKEYEAKLLAAPEARKIYEGYVRKNQDPALLEWAGTGMFKTSVFPVPPGAERKVTISFSQLLRKSDRLTDFVYPLSTAKFTSQPVELFSLTANIQSSAKIKSVYSPTHPVDVTRSDDNHATVKLEAKNVVPTNDFRLFFDTAQQEIGASVLSYRPKDNEDGYFLLLASPEVKSANAKLPPKTVVFALDRSGSMSGKKIEQAKEALKFVINNLRDGDLFNIVVYDTAVESFQPELQRYDDSSRKAALGFIEGIHPGGSTNISGALTTSLKMIQDSSRPNYLVFMTDGLPTTGERNEMKISQIAKELNKHRTRVVSFGVGYDVNSRLLDRITRDNYGTSQFVRPDEDIEVHVSKLYQRMSQPVMTDVKLKVEIDGLAIEQGAATNRVYPKEMLDLFAGDQVVVLGRYKNGGTAKVTLAGAVGDNGSQLDFAAQLTKFSGDQSFAFVEKLWAMRRIGEIIDELDLNGKNDELITELVALSAKHGILTPYTSFLADENSSVRELASADRLRLKANDNLSALSVAEGQSGVAQRSGKRMLQESRLADAGALGFGADIASGGGMGGGGLAGGMGGMGGRGAMPGGMGGAMPAAPTSAAAGSNFYIDAKQDKAVVVNTVQSVGQQTLFKRGNLWISDSARDIDPEKDSDKIVKVERFSEEYFKLVQDNSTDENTILSRQKDGEQLLVKLRGKYYRIQ